MPGGLAPLDEFFEALTLIQTRRINPFRLSWSARSFGRGLLSWVKDQVLAHGNIDRADLMIFNVMDDPDEIVAYIRKTVVL